jgi:hypothetical protein
VRTTTGQAASAPRRRRRERCGTDDEGLDGEILP